MSGQVWQSDYRLIKNVINENVSEKRRAEGLNNGAGLDRLKEDVIIEIDESVGPEYILDRGRWKRTVKTAKSLEDSSKRKQNHIIISILIDHIIIYL